MNYSNVWLRKTRETILLQVVEWAQRNRVLVEELTEDNIREALRDKLDQ